MTDDTPNRILALAKPTDGNPWTIRLWLNGLVDAIHSNGVSISPGFDSYEECEAWVEQEQANTQVFCCTPDESCGLNDA